VLFQPRHEATSREKKIAGCAPRWSIVDELGVASAALAAPLFKSKETPQLVKPFAGGNAATDESRAGRVVYDEV
jgi:hypothetical protein